ncbi:alpha-L-fucosidase [Sphingomonas sp. Leaf10]|uniref:alpha-L-fucosidase n=1 Tax=Sphingomonas sp. Leaf10 TaxID=1735676 RepID=UPI0006F84673|nr:alpha-L-fucosidase [Sphingomonas sp. Leaf10]KQM37587.1 alpha-L-fucosidase [Sphingomonas sp. Leaf10]
MKFSRRSLMGSSLIAGAAACTPRVAPVTTVAAGGGGNRVLPPAWGATPSLRQLKWHDRRQYGFIHFSINTFTDKEWGYGDEDPALFNPTDFDPDQIVAAAKAGELTGLILTAKHHDGFCLWPTMLTEHCIRNSPYKQGKGDIVGELEAACRRGGINFGVYLSPWDRNRADYGTPSYITYYRAQLTELCTRYGELFEVWFDGANGGDGYYGGARETRKINAVEYYNWPSIVKLVHDLQPDACTFDPLGADIRWVGNEDGHAADPCWPTMPNEPYDQAKGNTGVRGAELWWPAETNVSIRPGWFYHADEDAKVKLPSKIMEMYDDSIGHGTTFHLNLPPDRRGRIHDRDVASLTAFGDALRATFANNQADGAVATASADLTGASAKFVNDGRLDTFWLAPPETKDASIVLDLPPGRSFDTVRLQEWLPLGLRVTRFAIDVSDGGDQWTTVAEKDMVGPQRLVRLPAPISPRRVRFRTVAAEAGPALREFALFRSVAPVDLPPLKVTDASIVDRAGWKVTAASAPGGEAILDDSPRTAWTSPAPASLTIDMGRNETLAGFTLTPTRHVDPQAAPPMKYRVETSVDGRTWTPGGEGEFQNINYARATQRLPFPKARPARYLRFAFPQPAVPAPAIAVAEIGAFR